ncbi:Zn-finger containing protein [Clostridium polyendosporum]|uniref:Zn-finger containing protein n=1 Tax=Clostridium polyendosporum TaxID=69208 RepID=A0A919RYW3_9CLOT|nr:hypothetical protein [Clostridium polyendosporum]GIM29022.1 Zn-finger containing protein [Clostridium polyendosporum]
MKFFRGRYGFDLLSKITVILGLIFSLWKYTFGLGFVLLIIGLYRAFSKDILKRSNEALRFEQWLRNKAVEIGAKVYEKKQQGTRGYNTSIKEVIQQHKDKVEVWYNQKKNFKIVKCSQCGQKLRLPRKKGKVIVTCKKCAYEFKMKT